MRYLGGALLGVGLGEICMCAGISVFSVHYLVIMFCIILGVNFISDGGDKT